MSHRRWLLLLLVCVGVAVGCGKDNTTPGDDDDDNNNDDNTDTVAPVVNSVWPQLTLLASDTSIRIVFSEPMDIDSIVLTSDLQGEVNSYVLNDGIDPGIELQISPAPVGWTPGLMRELVVDAADLAGNSLATPVSVRYDIAMAPFTYVDPVNGDIQNDGLTPLTPIRDPRDAVGFGTLLLSEGVFLSDPEGGNPIALSSGRSIFGGWSSDFSVRDPVQYETRIEPPAGASDPGLVDAPAATLAFTNLDNTSILSGVTVVAPDAGSYTAALRIEAGAMIVDQCSFAGGPGTQQSHGIYISTFAAPTISATVAHGGTGGSSYGIYSSGAGGAVYNSVVHGGDAFSFSYGVADFSDDGLKIWNNTVFGGDPVGAATTYSRPVYMANTTSTVENNILVGGAATYSMCVSEGSAMDPIAVRNNVMFDCPTAFFAEFTAASGDCPFNIIFKCHADIDSLNALAVAAQNIDTVVTFMDPAKDDYRLEPSTPINVLNAGLNGYDEGFGFVLDRAGILRPASGSPWAPGAYEPHRD